MFLNQDFWLSEKPFWVKKVRSPFFRVNQKLGASKHPSEFSQQAIVIGDERSSPSEATTPLTS